MHTSSYQDLSRKMPQLHNWKTKVVNHKYASNDISYLYFPGVLLGQASVAPRFKRRGALVARPSRVRRSMASVRKWQVRPRDPIRAPLRAQTPAR